MVKRAVVSLLAAVLFPGVGHAMTLAWDAAPGDVAGYVVSYGTQPRGVQPYPTSVSVGNVTQWTFTPTSTQTTTYYFAVQTKNSAGQLSAYSAEVVLEATGGVPAPRIDGDFNGDGHIDLLWQNRRTGTLVTWLMSGTNMVGSSALTPGVVSDTNWKIVGIGDFNNDGQPDILWQHQVTRLTTVWLMNGTSFVSAGLLSMNTVSDKNWEIRAVADMNGDGSPDIIWQHKLTGAVVAWMMNGLTFVQGKPLGQVSDTNWKIVGTGDFDGDGDIDLVWQHQKTGTVSIWMMNGTTFASGRAVYPQSGSSDPNWKVVGVADLNGDTHPDLLWQHATLGYVSVWLMNGTSMIRATLLNPGQVSDLNWQIAAPR